MAESSWPTIAGGRAVTDDQWELMAAALSGDGIVSPHTDPSPVFGDSSGRQVKIRANKIGVVGGHGYTSGSTDTIKTIGVNSSGSTRIDLVVLGLDRTTWAVTTYVVAGTPGSGTPPALTRNARGSSAGKWEIPLASVSVVNGASTINAADVTDLTWYNQAGGVATVSTNPLQPPTADYQRLRYTDTGVEYVPVSGVWSPVGPWRASRLLSSTTGSVTFSSIPTNLRHLTLSWCARTSASVVATGLRLQINGAGGTAYSYNLEQVVEADLFAFQDFNDSSFHAGVLGGASAAANNFGAGTIDIPGWDRTPNLNVTFRSHFYENNLGSSWYHHGGGLYFASGPFTSLKLLPESGSFVSGSRFVVSGIPV